jgi:hypothetical protein
MLSATPVVTNLPRRAARSFTESQMGELCRESCSPIRELAGKYLASDLTLQSVMAA